MNDQLNPNSGLETISESGQAPSTRLKDASAARNVMERLIQANADRNLVWARIRGMFDGNPPFSTEKLRASGQGYRSNFSTLEGKSMKDAAKVPFYELFSGGKTTMWVSLLGGEDPANNTENDEWSRIVTEEVDRRMAEWRGFHMQMWKLIDDFVAFGRGHVMWENQTDWRFVHVPFDKVVFPDGTDVDTDKWEVLLIRQTVPVSWLWSRVRNAKAANSAGWDIKEVIGSIRRACPTDTWIGQVDYMAVQQQMKDNDVYWSSIAENVMLCHVMVKEYDGSWTWAILDERSNNTSRDDVKDGQGYLYLKRNAFPEIDQFMASFFFDVANGSINGLQGLGADIYNLVTVKDRMMNAMTDNTFFRSALILQANDASALQNASLTLIGNTVVVPPGVAIQNSQVVGDVETSLGVMRDLDARVQNNTGVYRAQMVKPSGNPRTATEAELQFSQAATLTSSAVNRFYIQLDGIYREIYRRMSKNDRTFIERCTARGVAKNSLSRPKSVTATRTIGGGSPVQRQQALMALSAFAPSFPEDGKQNFMADVVAAYTTQSKVDAYLFPKGPVEFPGRDHWEATQENAALKEGSPVIWTPQQNDSIHAQVHVGAAIQAFQAAQQGQVSELDELLAFLTGVVGHVTSTHLPRLQNSRPQEAKAVTGAIKELMAGIKELEGALQQQQQDQQAMQQADAKMQIAQMQAQHKAQIAEFKAQTDTQRKDIKAQSDIQRSNVMTAADIERQNATAMADIQRQNIKTAADIKNASKKPKAT